MANMPAFEEAARRVVEPNPGLGVGIHLCLTSGSPVSKPADVPLLVDREGRFRHGFLGLMRLLRSGRREAGRQIGREIEAQVTKVEDAGVRIDHVDSHEHVHMIPAVLEQVARLAGARNAVVRVPLEPLGATARSPLGLVRSLVDGRLGKRAILGCLARSRGDSARRVVRAHRVIGLMSGGRMTAEVLRTIVESLPEGVTEVFSHPGLGDGLPESPAYSRQDRRFWRSGNRVAELAALRDRSLRDEIARRGITLARFCDVLPHLEPAGRGSAFGVPA
jgi:predicted glycoside hydrolase/deacetylase ChbG (UPF0249 family)